MPDEGPDLATVAELFAGHCTIDARLPWNGLSLVFRGARGAEPLAVAILPVECDDDARTQRFETLVKKTEALAHPRIVKVRAHGVRHAVPWVEMDFDAGHTLADELDRGPMPPERAYAIARQILDALGHAHALGVLHCDLTPRNVLVHREADGRDHVRVVGFGLAQVVRGARGTDETGPTGKGSGPQATRYLAPELLAGDAPTARADIYSVGALLHHMLVGEPPSSKSPPPPGHARAVLSFAMAHAPNDRFEGASQMSHALTEWLAKLADDATPLGVALDEPGLPKGRAPEMQVGASAPAAMGSEHEPAPWPDARPAPPSERPPALGPPSARPAAMPPVTHAKDPGKGRLWIFVVIGLLVGVGATVLVLLSQRDTDRVVTPPTRTMPPPPPPPPPPEPPAPRSPLEGDVQPELAAILSRIEAGDRLEREDLAAAYQLARETEGDARPYLVLGRAFASMGWNSDAIDRYERAYETDPDSRHDERMLRDLIVIATRPESGDSAARVIRRIWGHDAVPALDEALEGDLRRDERDRLSRLRGRLAR